MLLSSILCARYSTNMLSEKEVQHIAKLAKRYPDKFDSVRALLRDEDAERKVLEE